MWCYGQVAKTIDSQSIIVGSILTSTTNIGVQYNGSIVGYDSIGIGSNPVTTASNTHWRNWRNWRMTNIVIGISLVICTICECMSYIPQIVKIIKTKKAEDLSLLSWVTWCTSGISYLVYLVFTGSNIPLILLALFEAICCFLILILTKLYGK